MEQTGQEHDRVVPATGTLPALVAAPALTALVPALVQALVQALR